MTQKTATYETHKHTENQLKCQLYEFRLDKKNFGALMFGS